MIIQLLIMIVISVLSVVFGWFPQITQLPYGMDNIVITAVSWFRGAMDTLPYLESLWTAFLIAVGFELALIVLRFILGSRTPVQVN